MPPVLSVVVPVYNVEDYLEPCLDSIAGQTFEDLQVVLVNDGSTDSSAEIAERYADRDSRFEVVHRPNGGLSAARNTGIEHARGEFLAFVDSDDVLPREAYERLVGSLLKTGSDFATGNVLRLIDDDGNTRPAWFLKRAFRETRLKTHITKFRPLLADRIAWNKVFRRPFWDTHGFKFPEGRINEDIPVILPLHFAASAVDVIADPVYVWRMRGTGNASITQRRLETRALHDRVQALTDVHDYLTRQGLDKARRWYDETLVADDLKLYVNVLHRADDEYRELFLEKVNALLDGADDAIYDRLPAIDRLKWHLVRRRLMPELVEVIRFERSGEMAQRPPIRAGRHWVGDYPYRGDPRLNIPDSVYRLDDELGVHAHIEDLRVDGDRLRIQGWAFIEGIGAAKPGAQRVSMVLLPPGRLRRLRYLISRARFQVRSVHRPDVDARARHGLADVTWSGFEATLKASRLKHRGRWRPGRWDLFITVRAAGKRRLRNAFWFSTLPAVTAVELPASDDVLARAIPTDHRELTVDVADRWAAIRSHRVVDGALELRGEYRGLSGDPLELELREAGGSAKHRYEAAAGAGGPRSFSVRVPLREALGSRPSSARPDDADDDEPRDFTWDLYLRGSGGRVRVAVPASVAQADAAWRVGGREVGLQRTRRGDASLVVRAPRAVVAEARFDEGGALVLEGTRFPDGGVDLVLFWRERLVEHAFPVERMGEGRFRAAPTPAAVRSLAGSLPLAEGRWALRIRQAVDDDPSAYGTVAPSPELAARLPLTRDIDHKTFMLAANSEGDLVLKASRDLDEDERGPFDQRRLRNDVFLARRTEPLTDSALFVSFHGRQYSDSPRAIHEELVRREASLEHLWVVRDGSCAVPDTARALRYASREYYEALARARYVVVNDHFPEWYERRPDQVCVQTWHGTPLKRLGFDVIASREQKSRFARNWARQSRNWQYVVSPNRFSTPILRDAYQLDESELVETGYPRDDVLAGDDLEARSRAIRSRLGLPDGVRVILYAPTYRDDVKDRRGRYRLEQRLDIDRLRDAFGRDAVLLYRTHHYIAGGVPTTADGFVRDVSSYPDGTELLLAADVLVTDYSSTIVDFANTGRPMLFFTYDLDRYRDEVRGLYIDFEGTVPGPLLMTSDDVVDALGDIDRIRAQYAAKYDEFARTFCELDDGRATARVVDRVFDA